jgi:hypothetical protein
MRSGADAMAAYESRMDLFGRRPVRPSGGSPLLLRVMLEHRMSSSQAGVTQLAECLLPKQNVAGSNPVSRSTSLIRILRAVALRFPRGVSATAF